MTEALYRLTPKGQEQVAKGPSEYDQEADMILTSLWEAYLWVARHEHYDGNKNWGVFLGYSKADVREDYYLPVKREEDFDWLFNHLVELGYIEEVSA